MWSISQGNFSGFGAFWGETELVPHEGHEGRDDDDRREGYQRRHLEAQALARPRAAEHEDVGAAVPCVDDLLLPWPERLFGSLGFGVSRFGI